MNIQTELYRTFYYVAKNQNISKAAEALFVSQPAVSKSIKKLEHELGCQLFIRNARGVQLSKEGEMLFEHVKKALEELAYGESLIEKIKAFEHGTVRVGVSNTLCKHYLIPYLEAFHEAYPAIKIVVINNTTHKTLELLDHGAIDFGVVSLPAKDKGYQVTELMKIHDIFVVKKGLYEHLYTHPNLSVLENYPLMLLEPDNNTRQFLNTFFIKNDLTPHPDIEIGSMEFLIDFAKIGLGIASVIREFVLEELESGLLVELPLSPTPPARAIGIVKHQDRPVSMASEQFIHFLHKQA